jgi:hypothetical protein
MGSPNLDCIPLNISSKMHTMSLHNNLPSIVEYAVKRSDLVVLQAVQQSIQDLYRCHFQRPLLESPIDEIR